MPVASGAEPTHDQRHAQAQALRCLTVCVVLEEAEPAAWWHALLSQIESHPHMRIGQILVPPADAKRAIPRTRDAARVSLLERLADTIVHDIVDRHQHQYRPLEQSPLAAHLHPLITELESATTEPAATPLREGRHQTADDRCDVIIQAHRLSSTMPDTGSVPVWAPDLQSLRERAIAALMARAPFFHMAVLEKRSSSAATIDWQVRTHHALPLQIFSITDLEIIAHACLPGVFMAELNRHRLGLAADQNSGLVAENRFHSPHVPADSLSTTSRPSPPAYLLGSLNLFWHQLKHRVLNRFLYEQWQLAVLQDVPITDSIDELKRTCMSTYRALTPPDGYSWADPHLAHHDGELFAFFEAIEIGGHRGWIDCARLDQRALHGTQDSRDSTLGPSRNHQGLATSEALRSEHHLSYPFTFEVDGDYWMIPETSSDNTVSLYRSTGFPDGWEHVSDLLTDVNVADCTLVQRDGRWWLFGNTMTHVTVDERDELRIWYADTLMGPWQPHPLNPVLTGVHHARMAGGFLHSGGELYRPSQFGGWRYGHAINLARVDCLDTEDYQETIVCQIRPPSGSPWLGCHSITHSHGVTLIDRVRRRVRLPWRRRPGRA